MVWWGGWFWVLDGVDWSWVFGGVVDWSWRFDGVDASGWLEDVMVRNGPGYLAVDENLMVRGKARTSERKESMCCSRERGLLRLMGVMEVHGWGDTNCDVVILLRASRKLQNDGFLHQRYLDIHTV